MKTSARFAALAAVVALVVALAATASWASGRTRGHARCPSSTQIPQLPRLRSGGLLRADVDGDRRPDTVLIRWAHWADGRCAFYLVVTTGSGTHVLPLGRWIGSLGKRQYDAPIGRWPSRVPAVEAIVDLGGPENLIALADNEGASSLFVRLVALVDGRFRWLPVGREGELTPAGPITLVTTVSCDRGGPLRVHGVYTAATPKHPNRWMFSSVTYRRRGWRFLGVDRRTLYGSNERMWRVARHAGMPGSPLKGCSVARSPNLDRGGGL